jgi:Flp pilus assembly pilin Flp
MLRHNPTPKHHGMSMAEYGLIMGVVAIVAIPALTMMGSQTRDNINQVSQNSNQLKDMVNILNAPANNAGVASHNAPSENTSLANAGASPLSLGGQNYGYQIGADGLIRFTTQAGGASNTTAVEGSQITQLVLAELQQALDSPSSDLSEDQRQDLKSLIDEAKKIARAQGELEELEGKLQQNNANSSAVKNSLHDALGAAVTLSEKAPLRFSNDRPESQKVMLLAKTIVTIANQNYLQNQNYRTLLKKGDDNSFVSQLEQKKNDIPAGMLLTNISTEANSTDTQAATHQLEVMNTAPAG